MSDYNSSQGSPGTLSTFTVEGGTGQSYTGITGPYAGGITQLGAIHEFGAENVKNYSPSVEQGLEPMRPVPSKGYDKLQQNRFASAQVPGAPPPIVTGKQ